MGPCRVRCAGAGDEATAGPRHGYHGAGAQPLHAGVIADRTAGEIDSAADRGGCAGRLAQSDTYDAGGLFRDHRRCRCAARLEWDRMRAIGLVALAVYRESVRDRVPLTIVGFGV